MAIGIEAQEWLRDAALRDQYRAVRAFSDQLAAPLSPEDAAIQSMPDVSPTRWHLAHTTWFFETFVLGKAFPDEPPYDPAFGYLFNSYYNSVGEQFSRPQRGLLSRPSLAEVLAYRRHIDARMEALFQSPQFQQLQSLWPVIEIGLHHEEQHQELMLTDIKHVFSINPLRPAYLPPSGEAILDELALGRNTRTATTPLQWRSFEEGVRWIGHAGGSFSYDNESPRHRRWLDRFELACRLVTNGEYLQFMQDGGYERPNLWLSEGWATASDQGWNAPLYWEQIDGRWWVFTLGGMKELDLDEPVSHVSYFEADAFARWAGLWLPTEAAWETAAAEAPIEGNFVEGGRFAPARYKSNSQGEPLAQLFGDVWEWTRSQYDAYPGYRPVDGALGEYNGKFMCNQFVLRGGSCATSQTHIRPTYRNFFPPSARWQFSGIRLCREST